jgi:hypothetical protein
MRVEVVLHKVIYGFGVLNQVYRHHLLHLQVENHGFNSVLRDGQVGNHSTANGNHILIAEIENCGFTNIGFTIISVMLLQRMSVRIGTGISC